MTDVQVCLGAPGDSASLPRVREELLGFSDFQLERLCLEFGNSACKHLPRVVANDMLSGSAKFGYLARLLPELQAKGSKPLIFRCVPSDLEPTVRAVFVSACSQE